MTGVTAGPAGTTPGGPSAWLARLGPLAAHRPPPSISRALAGVGGALTAAGGVALAGQHWASSGSGALGALLSGALLVAGVAATVRLPARLAVAGVGAAGVAAPAVAFFLSAGGGVPSVREVAILAALLLAGLYAAGPWRGHTFHLAILVVAGWVFAVSFGNFGLEGFVFGGFGTVGKAVSTAGAASMVVAVIYLGVGSWLHDKGLQGMATPFLGVAAVALPAGAFAVARDLGDVGTGAVLLTVGAAVALVGARCRRRGTTWLGLAVAVYGLLTLCDAVSDRTSVAAVVVVLAGAGLVFAAPYAGALMGEPAPDAPAGGPSVPSVGDPGDGSRGTGALAPLSVPDAPPEAPSPWAPEAVPTTQGPPRVRRPRTTRPPGSPRPPRPPPAGDEPAP